MNRRYKCCVKCRNRKQRHLDNNHDRLKEKAHQYRIENKDTLREKAQQYRHDNYDTQREKAHQYWIDNKDKIKEKRDTLKREAAESGGTIFYCLRCYKDKPYDEDVCPNGKTYNTCYSCLKSRYGET